MAVPASMPRALKYLPMGPSFSASANPASWNRSDWVNTSISNAKTSIAGTYRHLKFDKDRRGYLAEAQSRINRRFDLASLAGSLVHLCAGTSPRPEK